MTTMNTTDQPRAVACIRFVRISFCALPALIWGALFAIFDPTFGGICAIAGFWLGWQCTEARPERGESDNPNQLKARYDAETWAEFETRAKSTEILPGQTVWSWLHGKKLKKAA